MGNVWVITAGLELFFWERDDSWNFTSLLFHAPLHGAHCFVLSIAAVNIQGRQKTSVKRVFNVHESLQCHLGVTPVCPPEHIAGQKANKIPVKVSKNTLGEHF